MPSRTVTTLNKWGEGKFNTINIGCNLTKCLAQKLLEYIWRCGVFYTTVPIPEFYTKVTLSQTSLGLKLSDPET